MRITIETNVAAPIEKVWRAYTTPADIVRWNAASADWHTTRASVDLREGGTFSSRMEAKDGSTGFDFEGTYTQLVEHELIEYAFGDRKAEVRFTPGPQGVGVRVTFDPETTHPVEVQRGGWQAILDNFTRYVERTAAAGSAPSGQRIMPCLWFKSEALEAAQFYVSVLGGSVDKVHHAAVQPPGNKQGDVLFVEFTLAGQRYQSLNGRQQDAFNDAISMSLSCEDQAEVDRLWAALTSEGGRPVACGWLKDKYGLSWQIVPRRLMQLIADPDPDRARRAFQAMMHMVKIDIATLEAAADGR